jgi:hypothetical protein
MKGINLGRAVSLPVIVISALTIVVPPSVHAEAQEESPTELVRQTSLNEIKANNRGAKFMFCEHRQTANGSQTKLVVETSQATVGMLVAENGKPLTPEQRQAEDTRLQELASNPEALNKKRKAEKEDSAHTERIMKALPDAFLYEPDGTETGRSGLGEPGVELVRLKFRPNPKYSPPTRTEQVLTAMQGTMLIDARRHRIAKIDGTLMKDVGFGWGILGHLDKGGHFLVEQGEVTDDDWEVTRMSLAFTGKVLLFKNLNIKSDENFNDFSVAPSNLTIAQAIQFLKKHEAELAENHQLN